MDYNRIIIELLNRVSILEERVNELENGVQPAKKENTVTGKKYRYLSDYLYNSKEDTVRLSFDEIETIINERLPDSAYHHRAFWANTESHSIALSWLNVGYMSVEVDLVKHYVVFEKARRY